MTFVQCSTFYLLLFFTGSAGQGLKIGRVLQYRLFLSLVISLKGGGGERGRGGGLECGDVVKIMRTLDTA